MRVIKSSTATAKHQRGVTLIELMTVVSIVAILGALAVPSFSGLIAETALREHTTAFLDDLRFARSTAMKRGSSITMCASSNSTAATPTCAATAPDWAQGWIIFLDNSATRNNTFESGDELLRRQERFDKSDGIKTGTGGASGEPPVFVRFDSEGRTVGQMSSFTFKPGNKDAALERSICIGTTGRPRVTAKGTTSC